VPIQVKDVGEYFDHARKMWQGYGCGEEPLLPSGEPFEYEMDDRGNYTGRGHLLVRITFPEFPDASLAVEDWLAPRRNHIRRETYAYDLIYGEARLENWHRHHGSEHRHDDVGRHPIGRVTLEQAIEKSLTLLRRGVVPDS
jgi:hypothetical protein